MRVEKASLSMEVELKMEDNQPTSPPGPPPATPPASPPPPSAPPPSAPSSNRTIMLVLSYVWLLSLVPLLSEKDDTEVQWHAKHGTILTATYIVLAIGLTILSTILAFIPGVNLLGCGLGMLTSLLWLAFLVVHIICIMKALKDERFKLPVISDFVDRWQ